MLNGAHDGAGVRDQFVLGAGLRLLAQGLLEVVVEIFVRIVLGRVGREVEQLDLMAMALRPGLDLPGVVARRLSKIRNTFRFT